MNNAYFHFPYIGLTKGSVDKSFSVKKFTDQAGEDDTGSVFQVSNFLSYSHYKIKGTYEKKTDFGPEDTVI